MGVNFLYSKQIDIELFIANYLSVLNLNNMRDEASDRKG
jgi:hypothetical protein